MLIFFSGLFFWILALFSAGLVLFRLALKYYSCRELILWLVILAGAVLFLFRPHEDIYGGQDPGAYVNSAATFARQKSFFYVDRLLQQVHPNVREDFFYGHGGFRQTKDACLWIKNMEQPEIGPWFQPAYSVLMGLPTFFFTTKTILYITPLFTIFLGLIIAALSRRLFKSNPVSFASFLIFLFHPVIAWHGRCARPEIIAGFFVFTGLILLYDYFSSRDSCGWIEIILGSVCLAVSPFFHVLAWFVVLSAYGLSALYIFAGRLRFLVLHLVVSLALVLFAVQTVYVTDCYGFGPLATMFFSNIGTLIFYFMCFEVFLLFCGIYSWRFVPDRIRKIHETILRFSAVYKIGFAISVAALFILFYLKDDWSSLRLFNGTLSKFRITQMSSYVLASSMFSCVLGLAGWIVFVIRSKGQTLVRISLALILLPGILFVGRMPILMYLVRRMTAFGAPFHVLCLTSLFSLIPPASQAKRKGLAIVVFSVILFAGMQNRANLYAVVENKGFFNFLDRYAEVIKDRDGILLAEYSRIGAPFEHMFGVPTLELDNEHNHDYSRAFDAWEDIMKTDPDRPAYFLTPFQRPVDSRFKFDLVKDERFERVTLKEQQGKLPMEVNKSELRLRLYKMRLRLEHGLGCEKLEFPYSRRFAPGNVGLTGFANIRVRTWEIEGYPVEAMEELEFKAPEGCSFDAASAFLLIASGKKDVCPDFLSNSGDAVGFNRTLLEDDWIVYWLDLKRENLSYKDFRVKNMAGTFLSGAFLTGLTRIAQTYPAETFSSTAIAAQNRFVQSRGVSTQRHPVRPVSTNTADTLNRFCSKKSHQCGLNNNHTRALSVVGKDKGKLTMKPLLARWTLEHSSVSLPAPPDGGGIVLLMIRSARPDGFDPVGMRITFDNASGGICAELPADWTWYAIDFDMHEPDYGALNLQMSFQPAWNPGLPRFPSNLGALVGYIIVIDYP